MPPPSFPTAKTTVVTGVGSRRGIGRFGRRRTRAQWEIMAGRIDEGRLPHITCRLPVGRLGAVSKVSVLIEFLIGLEAGYITGSMHNINGGARIG